MAASVSRYGASVVHEAPRSTVGENPSKAGPNIVAHLLRQRKATPNPHWACYHTTLYQYDAAGTKCGVIGCAVGGPFAVLLAEQLFVSGCELLISITSAGQICPVRPPPYFVLIDHALRDEGASH